MISRTVPLSKEEEFFLDSESRGLKSEVNGGTRDRAQGPRISSPSRSAVSASDHCRCQGNPALLFDEPQTGFHARFGPTVCMQDSRSLEILMHMSGLVHPITREAENRSNSRKIQHGGKAPCSKHALAQAVSFGRRH